MALRDLLFKSPEPEPTQAQGPEPVPTPSLLAARLAAVRSTSAIPSLPGTSAIGMAPRAPDTEFTHDILSALGQAKLPGFKELNAQMDLLLAAIPNEGQRLQVAVTTTAAFLKLTPAQILEAVREQIQIMDHMRAEFGQGLASEAATRTAAYSRHLEDVDTKLARNRTEHDQLTADRASTATQLAQIAVESSTVSARFDSAFQPVYESLQAIASNMRMS